ncbi:MAG: hypothetical protein AAF958_08480 [Planctomycetota bacterium]
MRKISRRDKFASFAGSQPTRFDAQSHRFRRPVPFRRLVSPLTAMNDPETNKYGKWVEIEFDCLPLRSVTRTDVPVDASPAYEQWVLKVKAAMEKHGTHNTHFLYNGRCTFHLTNDPRKGCLEFAYEGTALADERDQKTRGVDLSVTLVKETCEWLNERIVDFFSQTIRHSVAVEFDRYIQAGDLEKTKQRLEEMEKQLDARGGFLGMHL